MNRFFSERLSPDRRRFLKGTLLLTGTGFACRFLGFFYRIFLSRTIGAEGLGLYNLMHPVYGICFALCAGSMQTALSQFIAARIAEGGRIFQTGLVISLSLAALLGSGICLGADCISRFVLLEPQCAPFLPLMGISVPFAALHSCVNGFYYGTQRSAVPAFSQLAEQILRMIFVFGFSQLELSMGRPLTVGLAAAGHLAGEIAAAGFTFVCLLADTRLRQKNRTVRPSDHCPEMASRLQHASEDTHNRSVIPEATDKNRAAGKSRVFSAYAAPLMALAAPLMGNRLILNLLASAEAILLPACLQKSGLSSADALSVYGVLTGMSLPFVLFPSAISNSMAVLLLPDIARAQAEGKYSRIRAGITLSLRYSLSMGILCIGIFLLFGDMLGNTVFHNAHAGQFIRVLSWLCPFLYLATTLGSILNGLGRTHTTFLQNTAAMALRLGFVWFGVPRFGIRACLVGMLASEIFLSVLHLISLKKLAPFSWNAADLIAKPALLLVISIGILRFLTGLAGFLPAFTRNLSLHTGIFFLTAAQIFALSAVYGTLLFLVSNKKH